MLLFCEDTLVFVSTGNQGRTIYDKKPVWYKRPWAAYKGFGLFDFILNNCNIIKIDVFSGLDEDHNGDLTGAEIGFLDCLCQPPIAITEDSSKQIHPHFFDGVSALTSASGICFVIDRVSAFDDYFANYLLPNFNFDKPELVKASDQLHSLVRADFSTEELSEMMQDIAKELKDGEADLLDWPAPVMHAETISPRYYGFENWLFSKMKSNPFHNWSTRESVYDRDYTDLTVQQIENRVRIQSR